MFVKCSGVGDLYNDQCVPKQYKKKQKSVQTKEIIIVSKRSTHGSSLTTFHKCASSKANMKMKKSMSAFIRP